MSDSGNQRSQAGAEFSDQFCQLRHIGLANHEASTDGISMVTRLRNILMVDDTLAVREDVALLEQPSDVVNLGSGKKILIAFAGGIPPQV